MNFVTDYFDAYYIQRQGGVAFIVMQVFATFGIALLFFEDIIKKSHPRVCLNKILFSFIKGLGVVVTLYILTFFLSSIAHLIIVNNNLSFYCLNYFVYFPILVAVSFTKLDKILERFVRCSCLYNALTIAPTLSRFISFVFSSEVYGFNFEFFDTFFCTLFLFAVICFLYVLNSETFENKNIISACLVISIEILVLIASASNDPSFSTTEKLKIKHIVIFSGLLCASLFIYLFHYVKHRSQEKTLSLQRQAFAKKNQNEMIQLSLENDSQIKTMQTKMNQQYRMMASLLEKEDYAKLKEYFADISETSFVPLTFVDCGNNAISCIMNIEIAKAKKENIKIHHTILVPKGGIGIDEYDLCSFFTNLIDNAIEGTSRNKENQSKDIYVNISYQKPYLISEIKNPTDLKTNELGKSIARTSKEDVKLHGYGRKIISSIAKKYGDGIVNYSIENGNFIVTSMLLGGKE